MSDIFMMKCGVCIAALAIIVGCGGGGTQLKEFEETLKKQQINLNEAARQANKNSTEVQQLKADVAEMKMRIEELEASLTNDQLSATELDEIKENLAFLNDQVLRLDNTIRNRSGSSGGATQRQAASAFRPEGFDIRTSYNQAYEDYQRRRYDEAIAGFNEILTVAPNSSLADNAQYWIGESYYAKRRWANALSAFQKVMAFSKSNKYADAQLKIGMTHERLGNESEAIAAYNAVIQNYPNSRAASIATRYLNNLGQ